MPAKRPYNRKTTKRVEEKKTYVHKVDVAKNPHFGEADAMLLAELMFDDTTIGIINVPVSAPTVWAMALTIMITHPNIQPIQKALAQNELSVLAGILNDYKAGMGAVFQHLVNYMQWQMDQD